MCCGPLHSQERLAETAEELMRSRYCAYALHDTDHVFRTWHPRTRPADVEVDPGLQWHGLEVVATTGGGPQDDEGEVEFRARYTVNGAPGTMHERSRFRRRGGRWLYLDGEDLDPRRVPS